MNTAAAQQYWEGQIVDGKFPLFEWLGRSALSAVFLTQTPGPAPQKAAIKILPVDSESPELQLSRWRQSGSFSHPNLLRIFDMGRCQLGGRQQYYIAMEYADENLSQVLPQRALSTTEVRELLPPVMEALSYLHRQGLEHGRLKPSNIVAVANQLKLSSESIYLPFPCGTKFQPMPYDAPEVEAQGFSKAGDVWSLGMTLVAAFTQHPIEWDRSGAGEPAVPSSVPEPYRQIARACLRANPSERCTLQEIRARLNTGAGQLPKRTSTAVSAPSVSPPRERRALTPLLAGAAVVLLAFGLIWMRQRGGEAPSKPITTAKTQPSDGDAAPVPSANSSSPSADSGRPASNSPAPSTNTSAAPVVNSEAVPGAVVERVMPEVPLSARRTIQGKVRVKVQLSVRPDGQVSSATLASAGPSRYFARLALEASRKWTFKPAQADGHPMASEWLLEYKFGRASTEVVPHEQH